MNKTLNNIIKTNAFGLDSLKDLAYEILTALEEEDFININLDNLLQAIEDNVIFTCDEWAILEKYCIPTEASWDIAYGDFKRDMDYIFTEICYEYIDYLDDLAIEQQEQE